MINWTELHRAFNDLHLITGTDKSSCGLMKLSFHPTVYSASDTPYIYVEFGGYSMPDMARHELLGPFATEAEAWTAACSKVLQQYQYVNTNIDEYINEDSSVNKLGINIPEFLLETNLD